MWKICSKPFQNAHLIFPTQQADVEKVVEHYSKDENVLKIIIFGSSVTSACNPWSDIDVYLHLKKEKKLGGVAGLEAPLDKWTNFTVDEFLWDEINTKGVTVYERHVE